MTTFLAGVDLQKASTISGSLGIPRENITRTGEKKGVIYDDILLNLQYGIAEERPLDILLTSNVDFMDNITCVTVNAGYDGLADLILPEEWKGRVFVSADLDEYINGTNEIYRPGIISLIDVSPEHKDLRGLLEIGKLYNNARFVGGRFLMVDGLKVGRFEEGALKGVKGIGPTGVAEGVYDVFTEVDLSELSDVVAKPVRVKKTPVRKPRLITDKPEKVKNTAPSVPKRPTMRSMQQKSTLVSSITAEEF